MGIAYVVAGMERPSGRGGSVEVRFLVDTGAIYSVLPERVWKKLGLKPLRSIEFMLADGTTIRRDVSQAGFNIDGQRATSPVVMGEVGDAPLLGAVTLETLGLMVSPVSRPVLPMRMMLAASRSTPSPAL